MKVLHVISGDLWAGAEVQAYTLLKALQSQHSIAVAAALMNDSELAPRLRQQGIQVFVFPEAQLGPLQILGGLRRLLRAWQPDVVHTHRSKENILGSIANALSVRATCIRTSHGANEHGTGIKRMILDSVDNWCGRHLQNKVIAVSADLATKLRSDFSDSHIAIVENGVDIDSVRTQVRPADFRVQAPDAIHIGIVGRLVPVKRVDLFLEMAAHLLRGTLHQQYRFHVFGDGPLLVTLQSRAKELQLGKAIKFHGYRSDIIACVAALDALVMCSDHEGLPMTLLEAMAVGTPVVAHAVGSLPELLRHSRGGIAVDRHDATGYSSATRELLKNRHAFHPVFNPRYSAANNMQRVLKLYVALASVR